MTGRHYAAAGFAGRSIPQAARPRRGLVRGALHLVGEILKLGVVLPLGLALAAVLWVFGQFMKL